MKVRRLPDDQGARVGDAIPFWLRFKDAEEHLLFNPEVDTRAEKTARDLGRKVRSELA